MADIKTPTTRDVSLRLLGHDVCAKIDDNTILMIKVGGRMLFAASCCDDERLSSMIYKYFAGLDRRFDSVVMTVTPDAAKDNQDGEIGFADGKNVKQSFQFNVSCHSHEIVAEYY